MHAADSIQTVFFDIVRKQLTWHSAVKLPDLYLIAHQAALGPAAGPADHCVRSRLEKEWNSGLRICRQDRLVEVIDPWGEWIRLHIRLFRKSGGSVSTLLQLCTESRRAGNGSVEKMERLLSMLTAFARAHAINCNADQIAAYTADLRAQGYPPVEHSDDYVAANHPGYCVVLTRLWDEEFVRNSARYRGPFYG